MTTSSAGVNYTYDGDGKRVQKSNGKLYWYGADGNVLEETDATGSMTNGAFNEYVYFAGKRIARRDLRRLRLGGLGHIVRSLGSRVGEADRPGDCRDGD